MQAAPVQTGLETLLAEGLPHLSRKRLGLITNPSAVNHRLQSAVDLLSAQGSLHLCALFGPEHGIRGDAQAGVDIASSHDPRTGLPIYSLYGPTRRPTPEMLAGLDALLYDIQDVGVRYYTYIGTLLFAQEAAAAAGLEFLVLDRPNPLPDTFLEGNVLDPRFASFVGAYSLPVRHGLTVGELARLFASERGWPPPTVVPLRGWKRSLWFDETDLPWIMPSPNLPTLDAVTLYPGTCLFEGTNCSEGRGTTRPFEVIGAPWIDPFQLAEAMNDLALPGVAFRPLYFTPQFSKHRDTPCGGVQLHITDRTQLRPLTVGLYLLHTIRSLYPDALNWTQGSDGQYFLDLLGGTDQLRLALERGATVDEIMAAWPEQQADFARRRQAALLYEG
uniref:DUF1343 domain-containing protein n=1 Tax=Thermosporothrix sp. COM3 TaxID=2490863 RepID=A0A455SHY4_9CHLR|nr:hypothetical protein KTC_20970 [Thermosporothrix sp. COM3]